MVVTVTVPLAATLIVPPPGKVEGDTDMASKLPSTSSGPLVGAFVFVSLQNFLAPFGSWVLIIQGLVFVLCVLLFRDGIVGVMSRLLAHTPLAHTPLARSGIARSGTGRAETVSDT